jgi:hypothetical protein
VTQAGTTKVKVPGVVNDREPGVTIQGETTDCLAWAGSTPESNSGLLHFEGRVASAAAPTAVPRIFKASRRESFFSVIDDSYGGVSFCDFWNYMNREEIGQSF